MILLYQSCVHERKSEWEMQTLFDDCFCIISVLVSVERLFWVLYKLSLQHRAESKHLRIFTSPDSV